MNKLDTVSARPAGRGARARFFPQLRRSMSAVDCIRDSGARATRIANGKLFSNV